MLYTPIQVQGFRGSVGFKWGLGFRVEICFDALRSI